MTYGTAETFIRNRLAEDSPTANQEVWTEAMVHDAFHEGELRVASDLPDDALFYLTQIETLTNQSGDSMALPSTNKMLRLIRMEINSKETRIVNPKTGLRVGNTDSLWRGTTSQYTAYFHDANVVIFPSISSQTVSYFYIDTPDDGSGTDATASDLEDHHAIIAILYAASICWERVDEVQLAAMNYNKYNDAINGVWARLDGRHGFK